MNPLLQETTLLKPHATDKKSYRFEIVVLKSSPLSVNATQHFISTCEALTKSGHNVTIIATDLTEESKRDLQIESKLCSIGRFIPKTIFGRFDGALRFVRALYTTLYISLIKKYNYMKPTLIVTYTADITMPLLNLFGNFPIIYFHHLRDVIVDEDNDSKYEALSVYEKLCVPFASKIIVAGAKIKLFLSNQYPNIFARSNILYHTIETKLYSRCSEVQHRELFSGMNANTKFFLAIGPLRPSSNFELIINAFLQLMRNLQEAGEAVYHDTYLVVATPRPNENMEHYSYMFELHHLLVNAGDAAKHVIEIRGLELDVEKSLMEKCVAYLLPGRSDLRQLRLLRAMHAKVPVLATKSCFALELLADGLTGLLVPDCPDMLFQYMRLFLLDEEVVDMLRNSAHRYYTQFFNFSAYQRKLHRIIMQ